MRAVLERFDDLISLLVLWHRLEDIGHVAGYPKECPSTVGWRASRQYDDCNGAFETSARGVVALNLGWEVDQLPEPHRTSLYILARNRASGVNVWTSPRLPADAEDRAALVSEALFMLADRL